MVDLQVRSHPQSTGTRLRWYTKPLVVKAKTSAVQLKVECLWRVMLY
ncbi:MAG: hypothetical protein AAFV90_27110 [Cyanobacteria bacterium J06634_5]